jgi:hypothetical protein
VNCANEAAICYLFNALPARKNGQGTCSRECFDFIQLPVEQQKNGEKGLTKAPMFLINPDPGCGRGYSKT